ncbi:hypothetical protein BDR26DRAFT_866468 [Obelidium mucronatum]|nr:hypothetical protein BDR26DRAFT_866468 [Obelidium mucronatum]
MRYNREIGVVRKLFEKGVDRQGPSPFDAENEVLVFWNTALPYLPLPETLQIFVPAYTAASSRYDILRGIRKEYVLKRIHIPFSIFPSLSWNWSVVEDGYAMADGRVDIYCFMLMLDKFMDDQELVNAIVRRQLMPKRCSTSIFSQDMNGNLTPLDFIKERIVLYPIGLYDGFAPPESLKEWNLIQQKATELAAENSFDEAANLFRKLIVSKLDVYGVKAPQTYENHVDIAAIRFAQHNLQQASKELRIFFENGPQRSKQLLKTAFDLMRQIAIMGDCPGLVGPFTAEHSKRGGKFAKSYNGLFSVYSKTGLFSRDVAVPVNRETATSIECVNSFFISGMFLHQQGRYEEALKRYGTALERRQLLFPDQLVALQTIRNHMQVTRLALCKRLMARGDYQAAYPVSKSYYEVSMEDLSWLAEPSTEACNMVKQCEKELGII